MSNKSTNDFGRIDLVKYLTKVLKIRQRYIPQKASIKIEFLFPVQLSKQISNFLEVAAFVLQQKIENSYCSKVRQKKRRRKSPQLPVL